MSISENVFIKAPSLGNELHLVQRNQFYIENIRFKSFKYVYISISVRVWIFI